MRLALAQQHASEDVEDNVRRGLAAMERAQAAGAQLIAFAELSFLRFFPARRAAVGGAREGEPIPGPTTERFQREARRLGLVTLVNLYEADGARRFDSSAVIDADGTLLGVTRMLHITDMPGFHEQDYYDAGDRGAAVYPTRAGRVGVAICYDRHYPEYMRALGAGGAELVAIPQAGALDEWPEGLYEAEVRTAAFQNGYFVALCNRVGAEEELTFAGESFVVDPEGQVIVRGRRLGEDLVLTDVDLTSCARSTARRLFLRDQRHELYRDWLSR